MTYSDPKDTDQNLGPAEADASGTIQLAGGATPDEVRMVDEAVLVLRRDRPKFRRAHFVVEATVEKAREILRNHRAS